jgi:hypothetical protein
MPGRALIQSRAARVLSGLLFAFYIGVVPAAAARGGNDHDGLPQRWERAHGTNPHVQDSGADLDADRLMNRGEFKFHTDPQDADSDDDGFSDGEEVRDLKTDPNEADGDNNDGAECDDDDGAEDADEPGDVDDDDANEADDDDDGAEDADEPGDVDNNDDDEAEDGDDTECADDGESDADDEGEVEHVVATIESYNSSTGRLTLKTTDNKTVTGIVTNDTELDWESLDGSEPDSSASKSDLDPGQKVTDYEFEDGSENFSEVDLAK